ncbi:hypothetical protein [Pantoea eucrina]|uniref:hypothetical protein n=1 Tax=Pantoea eucrina TaxID=472693 RepID=UPI001112AE4E|nr:hypothetical protein [Pantoea eucrina]
MTVMNTNLLNNALVKGNNMAGQNNGQQQRKPSEFWLNIGVMAGDEFISLPVGLPLDDMKPARANTNNAEWNQIAQAKNVLLEQLQQLGMQLEAGKEVELNLTVQLRRSAKNDEPAQNDNPLAAAVMAALTK